MQRGDDRTGKQKSGEVIKGESETAKTFVTFKSRFCLLRTLYLRNGKHITVFLPSYKKIVRGLFSGLGSTPLLTRKRQRVQGLDYGSGE